MSHELRFWRTQHDDLSRFEDGDGGAWVARAEYDRLAAENEKLREALQEAAEVLTDAHPFVHTSHQPLVHGAAVRARAALTREDNGA